MKMLPVHVAALLGAILAASPLAAEPPRRIVVLGGAITEILYDLHAEKDIVGIDTTSTFPAEALKSKASVGYVRALSAEGVLSLKPDLILATPSAGPADAIGLVKQTGVPFATIPDVPTAEGVVDKVRKVGAAIGANDAAGVLADKLAADFAALAPLRQKVTTQKRVLFLLSVQSGRVLAAGRGTSAASVIALAGARNALDDVDGFKPLSDEAIIATAPDAILVMRNAGPAITPDQVFDLPALAATPAGKDRKLVAIDGLLLLGFGPRTPAAARMLFAAIYPDLVPGTL